MDNNLADRLYRLRESVGESQDQVADGADISRVSYTRYENGSREPKVSVAIRLARHFGITVEQMCSDESIPSQHVAPQRLALSDFEISLIRAYRSVSRDTQRAVCNVLGIEVESVAKAN